ncbi:Permeases of the major facilitator superfamily [Polaromonas sp. CG9_12]|nr:Permeases of the major facilitator superfamily [Polaromonas sp. CG9_12]
MKSNVGTIDRILRIAIGLALIGLAVSGSIGVWGWLGLMPLATGLVGWCPPYDRFGWNTCAVKKN